MNKVLSICLQQVRLQLRQRGNLLMLIGIPIFFVLLFGKIIAGGSSSGIPLAVVDLDQSVVSQRLVIDLQADKALVPQFATLGELDTMVGAHQIEAALIIPQGYGSGLLSGQNPALDVRGTQSQGSLQVGALVRQHAMQITRAAAVAHTLEGSSGAPVESAFTQTMDAYATLPAGYHVAAQNRAGQELSKTSGAALGFTLMFVMYGLVGMAGVFLQEREQGTWQRILFSTASKVQIMGGYVLSFVVAGWLQFGILIVLTHLLFGVQWRSPAHLAVVVTATILAVSGLGLFLAGVVRSREQQRIIGSSITTVTSMLGGIFWPLDLVGPVMQKIAYLTPQAWAMDALREVMLRGGDWSHIALPVAVLLGMAAVYMTAGIARVRYN